MLIIKTISEKVLLFDETGLYIYNQKDSYRSERLIFALFMMIFACIGIFLQPNYKLNFFIISWAMLFLVWIIYLLLEFNNKKS